MTRLIAILSISLALFGCDTGDSSSKGPGGKADYTQEELDALLKCPDREPQVRQDMRKLLLDLETGQRSDITNVDTFIAALPEEIRRNVIFFTETRSMARIYPLELIQTLSNATYATEDREFYKDADKRWCVRDKTASQEIGCVEARIFVMSTEGDFIGTFTTGPNSPSIDNFELAIFDASTSTLDYFDVHFSSGKATVTKNPDDCMDCHGGRDGSVNYRMDPYRFWAYMTPFNEDLLRAGTVESEWYMSFLDRIDNGEEKLRHIKPFNTREQINAGLTSAAAQYQLKAAESPVDFAGVDTPGLNLSHQMLEKNACRAVADMARKQESFEKIRYAALGGVLNCNNIDEFFPTEGTYTKAVADAYFLRMGMGRVENAFDLQAMIGDTQARQRGLLAEKLSRRFDHLVQFAGEDRAMADIQGALTQTTSSPKFGVTNFDVYAPAIAKTRYLLEPLGVDVAQWTMGVDQESQTHVDFFFTFSMQPIFIDILRKEFNLDELVGRRIDPLSCNNTATDGSASASRSCRYAVQGVSTQLCTAIAAKSREALKDYPFDFGKFKDYSVENSEDIETAAQAKADATSLDDLKTEVSSIYRRCRSCHISGYDDGRQYYPFGDMEELTHLYKREVSAAIKSLEGQVIGQPRAGVGQWTFEYISTADRVWDRIARHPLQRGRMPPNNRSPLTFEQKVSVRAHMLKTWATP